MIDRREFLGRLAAAGCACPSLGGILSLFGSTPTRRVDLSVSLPGKKIQCFVCPMNCILEDGQTCFCRTRTNHGGVLYTDAFENPCILRLDPVEKLPIHHYQPGSRTLSLAVGGCNLRCQYCQNWAQSMKRPEELTNLDLPVSAAASALEKGEVKTLALAYTEPVAFLEYALDLALAIRPKGFKMIAATAAYANPPAMEKLARACAAVTIALKSFREDYYHKVCGIHLAPVLKSIETAKSTGTWIEVTNLIVPTLNDGEEEARELPRWIVKNLGRDVPLHIARFVPEHLLKNLPRTPLPILERNRSLALAEGLRYVYLSNVAPHDGNHTYCAGCKEVLIRRMGFKVIENRLTGGRCPRCKERLPGPLY